MKGLLYKEYAMLKPQLKSWLTMLVFFLVYTVMFQNISMMLIMVSLLGLMNCLNSFHYDKLYQCNEYIAAMPVSRFQMVLAKYLFILLVDSVLFAAVSILAAGFAMTAGGSFSEMLASTGAVTAIMLLMQFVVIPMVYAIGIDRTRYVNMVLWIVPWAIIMLKSRKGSLLPINENIILTIFRIAPVFLLAVLAVSFPLSVYIFRQKDISRDAGF